VPFFGSLLDLRRDRLKFFLDAAATYGDVVRLQFGPSHRRTVHLLRHPDHIKHVLVDAADGYDKHTPGIRLLKQVLGQGLLTSQGALWRSQRRLMQPAFHKQRIAAFGETMTRAGDELVDAWLRRPRPDAPVDLHREMMHVTLRIVTETLLGTDMPLDTKLVAEAIDVLLEEFRTGVARIIEIPRSVPTRRNRRFLWAVSSLDREVGRIIDVRRKSGAQGSDLLSMLMAAQDPETGAAMDDRQLRDEVMTMFVAGHETTATALGWTFYLLSTHPNTRRRLRAEIDTVLAGRRPTIADLPALDLTGRVLQESMRLYPPAWITARHTSAGDVIGGYEIPADSLVLMSPYLTHRHPSYWENPEGFDPERFASNALARMPRFAYFPFGGGGRLCIGSTFATVEATLLLATILRRVRLDLEPGQIITPAPGVTLRPRDGIRMRVVPDGVV
jgi:cytochrome P450